MKKTVIGFKVPLTARTQYVEKMTRNNIVYTDVRSNALVFDNEMEAGKATLKVARIFRTHTMGVMPKIFTEEIEL